ncbi:unnamed protein product [Leptidea sinapis]|uniref:Uncharacterized protein n=1 Tax=Leptidea sinapis TaxID=189913 RepID=A0A5E4R1N7_9NEOP|nr:unnamed protein product [Leptidea sinapis]
MFVAAKDPSGSGSSSDEGGFARDAEEGAGDSGHTLPVRGSRSDMTRQSIPVATKADLDGLKSYPDPSIGLRSRAHYNHEVRGDKRISHRTAACRSTA